MTNAWRLALTTALCVVQGSAFTTTATFGSRSRSVLFQPLPYEGTNDVSSSSSSTTSSLTSPSPLKSRSSTQLLASASAVIKTTSIVAAATALVTTALVKLILDQPSRAYDNDSVAREYDAWADDGILEYYWGEHIHLGYYNDEERAAGYLKKDFIQAKYDFIDELMKYADIDPKVDSGAKVLDVGCGFGGTSRYLAKKLGPDSHVTGITLSPNQVKRGTELAQEQGVADNTKFMVMDALNMDFPDHSFDIVWACESGEHMPDKKKYMEEMMRVLKPGGKFAFACWCQREDDVSKGCKPFDKRDKRDLKFLYEEWTHPYFVSKEKFQELLEGTGVVGHVKKDNWVKQTINSWRHSIWVGIFDPRGWIFKPHRYLKCFRDAYCLERMHRAFKRGLMEYGVIATTKKKTAEE